MSLITSDKFSIVIGLGKTGLSCARHLAAKGVRFAVADTREQPPGAQQLAQIAPDARLYTGELDAQLLKSASELILSPGVAQSHPAIRAAVEAGVELRGDIDLFCREISAPVIAITGSNAKSTVTTLVGEMARAAGFNTGVGGNLGTPVLDMLAEQGEQAMYVLELSSFQLETTQELRAKVACVLNISPDHLDRYDNSMQAYYQAKHRIYRGCQHAVENRDDPLTHPLLPLGVKATAFTLKKPDLRQFGILEEEGRRWLAYGLTRLIATDELKMRGSHNLANALAALAIGHNAGLAMETMLEVVRNFNGLEHRCQWVGQKQQLSFFNDSKGTNTGAALAALNGLGAELKSGQKIVLIAGGEGKGADFSVLAPAVRDYVRSLVLIGRDADQLAEALQGVAQVRAESMQQAVTRACEQAQPGDLVLLSPACASFDMFAGFEARGEAFIDAVRAL